jgi:hypothetical protein
MKPLLDCSYIRLNPIQAANGGVEVKKNGSAGTVFAKNSYCSRQRRKRFGQIPFVFLGVSFARVPGQSYAGLAGKQWC